MEKIARLILSVLLIFSMCFVSVSLAKEELCAPSPAHGDPAFCNGFITAVTCMCNEDIHNSVKCSTVKGVYSLIPNHDLSYGCTVALQKHPDIGLTYAECMNQWTCARDGRSADGTPCGNPVPNASCPGSGF
ncbi:MAG: hypothetical protein A3F12_00205 [Gammaproteobacteria bacterium RIFCSPHIGHO2_12_FULL_38_14]|nr:MAG: hypothetical protein A3F12_00205 [Gammaproteobacteria bacterium RIFCSPHIGHO2_12_FULL_38_14]